MGILYGRLPHRGRMVVIRRLLMVVLLCFLQVVVHLLQLVVVGHLRLRWWCSSSAFAVEGWCSSVTARWRSIPPGRFGGPALPPDGGPPPPDDPLPPFPVGPTGAEGCDGPLPEDGGGAGNGSCLGLVVWESFGLILNSEWMPI